MSTSADKLLESADDFFKKENYSQAAQAFEGFIKKAGASFANPQVSFNLARCYFELKNYKPALVHFHDAEEGYMKVGADKTQKELFQQLLFFMGRLYKETKQTEKAKSYLERAQAIHNRDEIASKLAELSLSDQGPQEESKDERSIQGGALIGDELQSRFGGKLNQPRLDEGIVFKGLIQSMAKKVTAGSEWFLVSMSWIKTWQKHAYLDLITDEQADSDLSEKRPRPGPIDCSDITQPLASHHIVDQMKRYLWQNAILKHSVKEGDDFMIVDKRIRDMWQERYGVHKDFPPIARFGIEQSDGETSVELHLKRVQFVALPNKKLFDFSVPHTFYMSKTETVQELEKKVCRSLSAYLYFTKKNKNKVVSKVRLWKSLTNNMEQIFELDNKIKNYTHVSIDAEPLNINDDQKTTMLDDCNIADEDILVVELPKGKDEFVFRPLSESDVDDKEAGVFADPLAAAKLPIVTKFTMAELEGRDIETALDKQSRRGLTGLQNLGNTCFMNSGLQCLSNTLELSKYFLFGYYKLEINKTNPLGMGGKLAKAYHTLIQEMWVEKSGRTAPWDLKKTLGSRISRFSGYGQQDACELVNYILDLMHEDLNRISEKPYIEMSEEKHRSDEVVSQEFWDAFIARNQSIIVDLMYGQLKSTVTCLSCGNISIAFDPYLTISLPIPKSTTFELVYIPFNSHTYNEQNSVHEVNNMPVLHFPLPKGSTVADVKKMGIKKFKLSSEIDTDDLHIVNQVKGRTTEWFDKPSLKADTIDQEYAYTTMYHLPQSKGKQIVELNFYKQVKKGKKSFTIDFIEKNVPRLQAFDKKLSIIELKKQIATQLRGVWQDDITGDENTLNSNVLIYVRDNLPIIKETKYSRRSAQCEFCEQRHSAGEAMCDLEINGVDANSAEGSNKVKLETILDHMKFERRLIFAVVIKGDLSPRFQDLKTQYRKIEDVVSSDEEDSASTISSLQSASSRKASAKGGVTLDDCLTSYEEDETLTGTDQWYCRDCKEHRDINKKLELYKVPKIMILQLKRFQSKKSANNGSSGFFNLAYAQICQQEKVSELVNFPIEGLDMRHYVKSLSNEKEPVLYDLFGVTNHFGSLNGGHYTASCLNATSKKWFNFNDSSVSGISDPSDVVNPAAYLLFYRKRE